MLKHQSYKSDLTSIFSIVLFSIVFFSSCQEVIVDEDTPFEHQLEETLYNIPEGDLEFVVIEGCEYIFFKEPEGNNHSYGYMAHKGNCKNPIHCYNPIDTLSTP